MEFPFSVHIAGAGSSRRVWPPQVQFDIEEKDKKLRAENVERSGKRRVERERSRSRDRPPRRARFGVCGVVSGTHPFAKVRKPDRAD